MPNAKYLVNPELTAAVLKKANEKASVDTTLLTWCTIHGALQLVLRNPDVGFTVRRDLAEFVVTVGKMLVENGFLTSETIEEAFKRESEFSRRILGTKKQ